MSKQKIFVEPTALYFPPPLTRNIINTVTVYNSTEQPCVFKVHSYEPELYTVKPSAAVLAANSACRVQITYKKMRADPEPEKAEAIYAELSKKQKFKVRAKTVPAATYAKVTKEGNLSGGDVWRLCGDVDFSMDTTLACSFNGDSASNVTFEGGAAAAANSITPRNTTAGGSSSSTNKAVTFGDNGPNGSGAGAIKSSLKSGTATTSGAIGSAESSAIKANAATKAAADSTVASYASEKEKLQREIEERKALLASLGSADAAASAQASALSSNSSKSGKKKKGGLPIALVLILVILLYVAGTFARLKVGSAAVDQYVASVVPSEVRSAVATSRAAMDEASGNLLKSVVGNGDAAAEIAAATEVPATGIAAVEEAVIPEVVVAATATKPVVEAAPEPAVPVVEEVAAAAPVVEEAPAAPSEEAPSGEKKKKRRKKVKKTE